MVRPVNGAISYDLGLFTAGQVSLEWEYSTAQLQMKLTVPVGAMAEVHAPLTVQGRALSHVVEGKARLWPTMADSASIWHVDQKEEAVVVTVGSGEYSFAAAYY